MLNLSTSPLRIPKSPNKPSGITSIARQTGRTSAFRQFGDSVSHTAQNERSGKIFSSISRAIKNRSTNPETKTLPKTNQNFKPKI